MAKFTQPQAKLQDVLSDPTLDMVMERYGEQGCGHRWSRKVDLVSQYRRPAEPLGFERWAEPVD